jgi:hypothetical protein
VIKSLFAEQYAGAARFVMGGVSFFVAPAGVTNTAVEA